MVGPSSALIMNSGLHSASGDPRAQLEAGLYALKEEEGSGRIWMKRDKGNVLAAGGSYASEPCWQAPPLFHPSSPPPPQEPPGLPACPPPCPLLGFIHGHTAIILPAEGLAGLACEPWLAGLGLKPKIMCGFMTKFLNSFICICNRR